MGIQRNAFKSFRLLTNEPHFEECVFLYSYSPFYVLLRNAIYKRYFNQVFIAIYTITLRTDIPIFKTDNLRKSITYCTGQKIPLNAVVIGHISRKQNIHIRRIL